MSLNSPEAYPDPAKDEWYKWGWHCEEVNQRVELEHEHQLVIGSYKPHEEVGHEQDVQTHVQLNKIYKLGNSFAVFKIVILTFAFYFFSFSTPLIVGLDVAM